MQPALSDEGKPERITAGIARLGGVLSGGIPRYPVLFAAGLPGTGKTLLTQQALFANARQGRSQMVIDPPCLALRDRLRQPDLRTAVRGDLRGET